MSKIDAETLGDAAVKEAREALKTALETTGAGFIKTEMGNIQTEIGKAPDGAGITKNTVTGAITKIQTALKAIKDNPIYEGLTDAVKSEFIALETIVNDLNTASAGVTDEQAVPEDFKTTFEEVVKIEAALSDLNAAQTADLNEMRDKLQSFVASPEDAATKLDSTNFTAFIDTLDTALSKISDQRAKLG